MLFKSRILFSTSELSTFNLAHFKQCQSVFNGKYAHSEPSSGAILQLGISIYHYTSLPLHHHLNDDLQLQFALLASSASIELVSSSARVTSAKSHLNLSSCMEWQTDNGTHRPDPRQKSKWWKRPTESELTNPSPLLVRFVCIFACFCWWSRLAGNCGK